MMTRWLRPPELELARNRDRFDPIVEGARHGLSRDPSLRLWERVCAAVTDGADRLDVEAAEQRFLQLAPRLAARGGRLAPDAGRMTRVGAELEGDSFDAWGFGELAPRAPGRTSLAVEEDRRWPRRGPVSGGASEAAAASAKRVELPGASDVAQAMSALFPASHRSDSAGATEPTAAAPGRLAVQDGRRNTVERFAGSAHSSAAGHTGQRGPARLPAAMRSRMERAFGQRFDDVEIHADSAEVPAGQ